MIAPLGAPFHAPQVPLCSGRVMVNLGPEGLGYLSQDCRGTAAAAALAPLCCDGCQHIQEQQECVDDQILGRYCVRREVPQGRRWLMAEENEILENPADHDVVLLGDRPLPVVGLVIGQEIRERA